VIDRANCPIAFSITNQQSPITNESIINNP
jgi:hypothetical protein